MHFPLDDWRPSIVVLWFVPFGEGPRFFNFPDLDAVLFDDFGGLQLKVHKEKRSQHVFQRCVTSRPKRLYNTVWRILSSLTLFQMCKIRLLHRCMVRKSPCVINRFRWCVFCCCHVYLWYKMIKINVSWVGQSITAIAHFPEMHLSNKMKENAEINDISKREQMTRMIWFLHITESNMMIFRWNILNSFWIKSDSSIVTLQLNEKCG